MEKLCEDVLDDTLKIFILKLKIIQKTY